jgi:hypothetical protein
MGFFKNLMNKITGGGAKLTLELVEPKLEGTFLVRVNALVSEAELKIAKVYLNIKSVENAVVRNVEVADGDQGTKREDVEGNEEVFHTEVLIAGPQILHPNQTYKWEKEISLPSGVGPTFIGKNISHEWYFLAGLDVSGNDPDSGWAAYELY